MYTQLSIENFRGIRSLTLDRMARVNLLVGSNSVGKTSVLEAIWLLRGAGNPELPVGIAAQQGSHDVLLAAPDSHWLTLFPNLDMQIPIELSGITVQSARESLRMRGVQGTREAVLSARRNGNGHGSDALVASRIGTTEALPVAFEMSFDDGNGLAATSSLVVSNDSAQITGSPEATRPAVLLTARTAASASEIATRFSTCQDRGKLPEIVNTLRLLDPELETLSLGFSRVGPRPILYMNRSGVARRLPFEISGGGGRRLLELLLAIYSESSIPVMIDEIENGIYYANLENVWKAIDHASQASGCQLFVTTHSLECIHAAINAFESNRPDDLRIFRLESQAGNIRVVDYDFEVALAAAEANLEMR